MMSSDLPAQGDYYRYQIFAYGKQESASRSFDDTGLVVVISSTVVGV